MLLVLMVINHNLVTTSWTEDREERIRKYREREGRNRKGDRDRDLDDLEEDQRRLDANGLPVHLHRVQRLLHAVPAPHKGCNDPANYENDSLSLYNQTFLQETYFGLFRKFAYQLMDSSTYRSYLTPQMFGMIEDVNLQLLSTTFKYITITQCIALLIHLLLTAALVITLNRRGRDRQHIVTALSPEQIQQLETNFATKYEKEQKESKSLMLDMLHILETHKKVMESQYRLQQAACDHSLHILDAGTPHSTGSHGWFNNMRSSMRQTSSVPPRPPAPIDPHTFYVDDRLPTGESPAVLPVTSSTTSQFQQTVTVKGAEGGTVVQDKDDDINSATHLMSLTDSDDEDADQRLAQARILQNLETTSSLTSDSRFASLSRRGRKGTFGQDPARDGVPLQEIHRAAAVPPVLPPPPPIRRDLAKELANQRRQMGLPPSE